MSTAFCFDLDGTVTTAELLPCSASELGIAEEMATLTRVTMDGLISFEESLRLRCLILGSVPVARVHEIIDEVELDQDIAEFIDQRSDRCFLLTGNLDVWVRPLSERLGCHMYSSTASISGGRLALTSILSKGRAIADIRGRGTFDRVVAIGDSENDIPMLRDADLAVAYGGVHNPTHNALLEADFVVYDGAILCELLTGL